MSFLLNVDGNDGINNNRYIKIDSFINPHKNISFGNIEIIDQISIEFDIMLSSSSLQTNTSSLNTLENVFILKQQQPQQQQEEHRTCTQYPSLWFNSSNNMLYFSSIYFDNNTEYFYCIQPLFKLIPFDLYTINIKYDQSQIKITKIINTDDDNHEISIVFESETHWFSIIENMNNLTLWITDLFSIPAKNIILSNIIIDTSPTTTTNDDDNDEEDKKEIVDDIDPNNNIEANNDDLYSKNVAKDTIFIIEVAVLTVFAFACLGVIIASLCLIKMRQSTKNMSLEKDGNVTIYHQQNKQENDNNDTRKPHKQLRISIPSPPSSKHNNSRAPYISTRILSNSSTEDDINIFNKTEDKSPSSTNSNKDKINNLYNKMNKKSNKKRDSTLSDLESNINIKELYSKNKKYEYEEELKLHCSKSEATYYQQQIPKYDSSTLNTNQSSLISKIGDRSFKIPISSTNSKGSTLKSPATAASAPSGCSSVGMLAFLSKSNDNNKRSYVHSDGIIIKRGQNNNSQQTDDISPAVLNSPALPESPKKKQIIKPPKSFDCVISDDEELKEQRMHHTNNKTVIIHKIKHITNDSECGDDDDDDAYDLNSEEGDDIKLRRAAIQSQRFDNNLLLY